MLVLKINVRYFRIRMAVFIVLPINKYAEFSWAKKTSIALV